MSLREVLAVGVREEWRPASVSLYRRWSRVLPIKR